MSSQDTIHRVWPQWHVMELLGTGSYGSVYSVVRKDSFGNQYAAVKVVNIPHDQAELDAMRAERMDEEAIRENLEDQVRQLSDEIRLMESVKGNTNIVSIEDYHIVFEPEKLQWQILIRMELLTSLVKRMAEAPLTRSEVVKLGVDMCRALTTCREKSIVHRDIKPDNIFVNAEGDYKLGDFGVARKLERRTVQFTRIGNYDHMAPEIYNNTIISPDIDSAAKVDIYSLGIVLYTLLNRGRLPFLSINGVPDAAARNEAIRWRMQGKPLPPPVNGTRSLNRVILKACAYRPEDRYDNAAEMMQDLLDADIEDDDGTDRQMRRIIVAIAFLAVIVAALLFTVLRTDLLRSGEKQADTEADEPSPSDNPETDAFTLPPESEPTAPIAKKETPEEGNAIARENDSQAASAEMSAEIATEQPATATPMPEATEQPAMATPVPEATQPATASPMPEQPAMATPMPDESEQPAMATSMPEAIQTPQPATATSIPEATEQPATATPMPEATEQPATATPMLDESEQPATATPMPEESEHPATASPMPEESEQPAMATPVPEATASPAPEATQMVLPETTPFVPTPAPVAIPNPSILNADFTDDDLSYVIGDHVQLCWMPDDNAAFFTVTLEPPDGHEAHLLDTQDSSAEISTEALSKGLYTARVYAVPQSDPVAKQCGMARFFVPDSGMLYDMACTYRDGSGTDASPEKAVRCFELAAALGDAEAMDCLGIMYAEGDGVMQSYEEAVRCFEAAVALGSTDALKSLGQMYNLGLGVAQSDEKAFEYFKQAADAGDSEAQLKVALAYVMADSYEEAVAYYQRSAEQGNAEAQMSLGILYETGLAGEQSYEKAAKYYQLAADQGSPEAMRNLGMLFLEGRGVLQSTEKALEYFRLAADLGDVGANYNLGTLYLNGIGVKQSYERAFEYFTLAAEQGYADAQTMLGMMYQRGYGVEQSNSKAAMYYRMAARQGDETAQSLLDALGGDGA